jgi:hypothetical protein
MKNKNESYITSIDEMFDCYFKEQGCLKIPVRMIGELTGEIGADGKPMIDAVLLCRNHSIVYVPKNQIVIDEQICSNEVLEEMAKLGI